jgi:predicted ATP-grasp superfamily ATP-dependent carboligase
VSASGWGVDRPCIVLGGGITGLGVVRSLGRAGPELHVVAAHGDLAGRSRFVTGHIDDVPETDDPDVLARALVAHGFDEAVLFPCSDTWAQAVARMSEEQRARYPSSISAPDVLELLVDKALFYSTADRFDLPHPRTRVITSSDEIDGSELDGHFLKPSNSQRFNARYRDKAFRFDTLAGAQEGLELMASAGVQALLQEYIPGPPNLHYFVDGYLDRDAVLRAVFVRRRTRMFPVSFGNSTHMTTVPPSAAERAVDSIVRLLTGIGFHGTFSAEFKRDPRDGEFKLLEVNGRPWWYVGFAVDCGVDVPMLSYREALGLELETVSGYRTGIRCVLLHLDMRAFLYEHRVRGLTLSAWLRSVVGARSTVFAWEDPRPAGSLVAGMVRTRLPRPLKAQARRLRRGG